MKHFFRLLLILFTLLSSLTLATASTAHAATSSCVLSTGTNLLQGNIGGSNYTIEVPSNWNGTLLLYNHGYVFANQPLANPAQDAPNTQDETAFLQEGYALAGDSYSQNGWAVQQAFQDQIALLNFFSATCSMPARTITWGGSMGGLITAGLAQLYPQRFAGALPMCGILAGTIEPFNQDFDNIFAFNQLLAHGTLPTSSVPDPAGSYAQALSFLSTAQQTPQGRARIALISAFNDTPDWFTPTSPEPGTLDFPSQEQNQFLWNQQIFALDFFGGADFDARAGGNPVWNTGIDYRKQLLKSVNLREVLALYRQAGLDLNADLNTLNAAPRISADPQAVAYANQYIRFNGELAIPVLTLHTTGDGLASNQQEEAYASVVRRAGDAALLRQLFIHRAGHCSFTPAEEQTALHTLIRRIATGRWDDSTRPALLNQEAAALGPANNTLPIFFGPAGNTMPPAFITFHPAPFLRPGTTPPAL